ncbi:MAG: hypothetical protein AAB734_04800 [Patescibacteria group bacterium]
MADEREYPTAVAIVQGGTGELYFRLGSEAVIDSNDEKLVKIVPIAFEEILTDRAFRVLIDMDTLNEEESPVEQVLLMMFKAGYQAGMVGKE